MTRGRYLWSRKGTTVISAQWRSFSSICRLTRSLDSPAMRLSTMFWISRLMVASNGARPMNSCARGKMRESAGFTCRMRPPVSKTMTPSLMPSNMAQSSPRWFSMTLTFFLIFLAMRLMASARGWNSAAG